MFRDIHDKLSRIEERINRPDFMKAGGAANEIGYYIFDYNPIHELIVRQKVRELVSKYSDRHTAFTIKEFDLFEVMLDLLKERGYMCKSYEFEEKKGFAFLQEAITRALRLGQDNLLVKHIKVNTPPNCIVFLTGVGKSYPLVRSHNIINILQEVMDSTPVILFYPGEYKHFSLSLFGSIQDGNHYRALPLIQ